MKKIFLTVAIVLGGLSSYATSASVINPTEKTVVELERQYKQIKTSELPDAVLEALASDFNRATLSKAYINAKEEYKLVINVQEVTSAVHTEKVYVDKFGNWIIKNKGLLPDSTTKQEITQQ